MIRGPRKLPLVREPVRETEGILAELLQPVQWAFDKAGIDHELDAGQLRTTVVGYYDRVTGKLREGLRSL